MAKDVTKPWKSQFFDTKEVDTGKVPKTFMKPPQHGLIKKKEKRNANKHSGTGN